MESEYKVQLEAFEGPLDLLLYLVKKDEVDIYDISIERITSQYLEYLETFEVLHIEVAGEFLVMAAKPSYAGFCFYWFIFTIRPSFQFFFN